MTTSGTIEVLDREIQDEQVGVSPLIADEDEFLTTARVIFANPNDKHAARMLELFAMEGAGNSRRPRLFERRVEYGRVEYWGYVRLNDAKGSLSQQFPVRLVIGDRPKADVDWTVYTAARHPSGVFTTGLRKLGCCTRPEVPAHVTDRSRKLALFHEGLSPHENPLKSRLGNAANHLAAEVTASGVIDSGFLSYPGGREGRHYGAVARWLNAGRPFRLVSAACLNAAADRERIVDGLASEIVETLIRVARATFEQLPIASWAWSTFGPDDVAWLDSVDPGDGDNKGMRKVLLPYQWDLPREEVERDLAKNFRLTADLCARLNEALPFPVHCHQVHEGVERIDLGLLLGEARERGKLMLARMRAKGTEPWIFRKLKSEAEKLSRLQQEAMLYLLDVLRYGHDPMDPIEQQHPVLYALVEVHGGYWEHGSLFDGPNGEFLPIGTLPTPVRQHWGEWVLENRHLNRDRAKLQAQLSMTGY